MADAAVESSGSKQAAVRNRITLVTKHGERFSGVINEKVASLQRRLGDGQEGEYSVEIEFESTAESGGPRVVEIGPREIASMEVAPCADADARLITILTAVTTQGDRFSGPVAGTCEEACGALNQRMNEGGLIRLPFTDERGIAVIHSDHVASISFAAVPTWDAPNLDVTEGGSFLPPAEVAAKVQEILASMGHEPDRTRASIERPIRRGSLP